MTLSVRTTSAALALSLAAVACVRHSMTAAAPAAATTAGYDAQVTRGLEQLRAATKPFQSLDSAVVVGYARDVPDCLVHEHHGAMGYHHINSKFVDNRVDIAHPEILLYQRMPDGQYRLNGVEFIVPYRAWARDSVAPVVMGQQLKHEDNLKIWYLHTWAWTKNSDGLFADFNPDVTCPANASKVFTPFVKPGGLERTDSRSRET